MNSEIITSNCRYCGKPTEMTGTGLCDCCWELERRISENIELAEKIIAAVRKKKILDFSEYCKKQKICEGCIFYRKVEDGTGCMFKMLSPDQWFGVE